MKKLVCALLAAGIVSTEPAFALPGDSISAVVARMKHKQFKVTGGISEIGGNHVYQAVAPFRGNELGLYFQDSHGVSEEESVGYIGALAFNVRKDPRVREAVSLVYDPSIAADFIGATPVGRAGMFQSTLTMTFYRGARYGYGAYGSNLRLYRLSNLKQALAEAKRCATRDCGD